MPEYVDDRRAGDAKFCAPHFADKVQFVEEVGEMFKAMGGARMVGRLEQAKGATHHRFSKGSPRDQSRIHLIQEKYRLESKILGSLQKRKEAEGILESTDGHPEKQEVEKVGVQGAIGKGTDSTLQSTGLRVLDLKGAQWLVDWANFVSWLTWTMSLNNAYTASHLAGTNSSSSSQTLCGISPESSSPPRILHPTPPETRRDLHHSTKYLQLVRR